MRSYPFTSQVTYDDEGLPLYDRAVDSAFLRNVFAKYFSDGIFYKPTNALQVVADTGMKVAVEPGCCHIQGAIGIEDSRRTLVVQASESLDRIDTVVARLDLSLAVRDIDLYVVKGTAAVSPQPPALTRDATVWELGLANLFVAKNTQTISQQRITDTRLDASRCGVVAQTIGELDTSPYFAQIQAALADIQQQAAAQLVRLEFDFDSWFDSLKGKLGDDPATALQAQVDDLQAAVGGMPLELSAGTNSIQITSAENRIESVTINGFTTQTGSGDPSPTNIRPIENAGADGTTFVDVNGEQTQVTLQAPLHEGDTLQTNVLYQGAQKCVETHTRSVKVLTGSENLTATTVSERTYFALPLTNVAKPASGTDVTEAVSNALQAASQNTLLVNAYSFCVSAGGNLLFYLNATTNTVQQAQALLSSLYAAGTPVTVEYPLEQPEVYAADPVQISNPAGTYTVSGGSGTTCQVYMKPVQDGGDAATLNGNSWSDIPTLKLVEYTYPQQEIQASARIEFEAGFSAVGIPDSANVASIQVLSTGWGGVVPQAWYAATSAKTINLDLYNATSAAHTVAPQIVVMYF